MPPSAEAERGAVLSWTWRIFGTTTSLSVSERRERGFTASALVCLSSTLIPASSVEAEQGSPFGGIGVCIWWATVIADLWLLTHSYTPPNTFQIRLSPRTLLDRVRRGLPYQRCPHRRVVQGSGPATPLSNLLAPFSMIFTSGLIGGPEIPKNSFSQIGQWAERLTLSKLSFT